MNITKYIVTFLVFFILQLIVYNFLKTGTDITILDILGVSIIMIILLYLWDLLFLGKQENRKNKRAFKTIGRECCIKQSQLDE